MLPPRLAKLVVICGVACILVAVALAGGNMSRPVEEEDAGDKNNFVNGSPAIGPNTELLIVSWCPVCVRAHVVEGERIVAMYRVWQGMTRGQLEVELYRNFHSPTIQEFGPAAVIIDVIERCEECQDKWPEQGIISIHNGKLAIFTLDWALVEVLKEDIPGDWYHELEEGIEYNGMDDCQLWIENLIS